MAIELLESFSQLKAEIEKAVPADDPELLKSWDRQITQTWDKILAYHDRSDGGLFVTVAEMCFAAHAGAVASMRAGPVKT